MHAAFWMNISQVSESGEMNHDDIMVYKGEMMRRFHILKKLWMEEFK